MTPAEAIANAQKALEEGLEGAAGYSCADVSKSDNGRWTVSFAKTDAAGRIVNRLSLVVVTLDGDGRVAEVVCRSLRPGPDRRPWWKKKRWLGAAAILLSVPVLIALSEGPAHYYFLRGRIELNQLDYLNQRLYRPFHRILPGGRHWRRDYVQWWEDLAERHGRVYRAKY